MMDDRNITSAGVDVNVSGIHLLKDGSSDSVRAGYRGLGRYSRGERELIVNKRLDPIPRLVFVAGAEAKLAFVLMIEQAAFAQARAAMLAVEFIAVTNFVPAGAAFYAAVDKLKHCSELRKLSATLRRLAEPVAARPNRT